ncbi:MAG: SCO family protein, partial [Bacteroidota bacterium]
VADFKLVNQAGDIVTQNDLRAHYKVVDFFFTSCPSICPQVQQQMLRIHENFADADQLLLVSFTLDPKRDTPERLAHYAQNLGFPETDQWQFLTGDRRELFRLAEEYFNIVTLDDAAPGGIDHTGRIVLLDREGYIRAWTNGVNPNGVDTLMEDIRVLLNSDAPPDLWLGSR